MTTPTDPQATQRLTDIAREYLLMYRSLKAQSTVSSEVDQICSKLDELNGSIEKLNKGFDQGLHNGIAGTGIALGTVIPSFIVAATTPFSWPLFVVLGIAVVVISVGTAYGLDGFLSAYKKAGERQIRTQEKTRNETDLVDKRAQLAEIENTNDSKGFTRFGLERMLSRLKEAYADVYGSALDWNFNRSGRSTPDQAQQNFDTWAGIAQVHLIQSGVSSADIGVTAAVDTGI